MRLEFSFLPVVAVVIPAFAVCVDSGKVAIRR